MASGDWSHSGGVVGAFVDPDQSWADNCTAVVGRFQPLGMRAPHREQPRGVDVLCAAVRGQRRLVEAVSPRDRALSGLRARRAHLGGKESLALSRGKAMRRVRIRLALSVPLKPHTSQRSRPRRLRGCTFHGGHTLSVPRICVVHVRAPCSGGEQRHKELRRSQSRLRPGFGDPRHLAREFRR